MPASGCTERALSIEPFVIAFSFSATSSAVALCLSSLKEVAELAVHWTSPVFESFGPFSLLVREIPNPIRINNAPVHTKLHEWLDARFDNKDSDF